MRALQRSTRSLRGSLALTSAALLSLAACRATQPAVDTQSPNTRPAAGGDQSPRPAGANAAIRARAARVVPSCTTSDPVSLVSSSVGVDPRAAIARSSQGGMVAFIARGTNGAHVLKVLALTATGTASGAPREITGAVEPSDPAIVAAPNGYVLAFRDHADWGSDDNVTRERIIVMALGNDGAIARWPSSHTTIAQGQPLEGAVAIVSDGTAQMPRGFGVPALAAREGRVALVVPRGRGANQQATAHVVDDVLGAFREHTTSLGGALIHWRASPSIAIVGSTVRWTIAASVDGAPSLATGVDSGPVQWEARWVSSPSSLAIDDRRMLSGYVNVTQSGSTVRVRALASDSAPSSVGVYSKALDPRVSLVRLSDNLVGALTLSQQGDDGTGSINLSLTDADGAFIGRHASLASLRMRSSRVAAAAAQGSAWVLVDGRADDGAAVLGLVSVRCNESSEANANELPTATMVQEAAAPDVASVTAENPAGLARCAAQGAPTSITTFTAEGEDVTADASAATVVLRDGRVVFFGRRRVDNEHTEVIAAMVSADPAASVAQTQAVPATGRLLDAAEINGEAFAVDSNGALFRSRGRGDVTKTQIQVAGLSSARFVRGGSGIVALSMLPGEQLVYIPITAGRPGRPTGLALNEHGVPHVVLDAVLSGATAHALVATSSAQDSTTARAIHSFDPSPRALASSRSLPELMADPISVGGAGGALIASGSNLSLLYWDRETVRAGTVQQHVLRDVRSVFQYFRGGGAAHGMHHAGADTLALTSTPGFPTNVDDMPQMTYAITVHGAQGAPRAYSFNTPPDNNAIVTLGDGFALPNGGIGVVYARSQPNGQLQWLYQRATCAAPQPAASAAATNGGAR